LASPVTLRWAGAEPSTIAAVIIGGEMKCFPCPAPEFFRDDLMVGN
jgi:hypothetical protein